MIMAVRLAIYEGSVLYDNAVRLAIYEGSVLYDNAVRLAIYMRVAFFMIMLFAWLYI